MVKVFCLVSYIMENMRRKIQQKGELGKLNSLHIKSLTVQYGSRDLFEFDFFPRRKNSRCEKSLSAFSFEVLALCITCERNIQYKILLKKNRKMFIYRRIIKLTLVEFFIFFPFKFKDIKTKN